MPLLQSLEASALARAIREGTTLYPAIETVHILGLATLLGSILLFDLRVLGRTAAIPLPALATHVLPLAWIGFACAAATGLLMFAADATALARNPAFLTKLGLIALSGANVALFHRGFGSEAPGPRQKLAALLSIMLWIAVLTCGRLIAYV